ncbi:MAG: carboxypeptidase-like regulatory domain-containing protein, partial [Syntrophales bacterium LBB04]|nr:carboxypeptidase-like regulatory domain-containing protein [Syntrophales bacterium LBB04]
MKRYSFRWVGISAVMIFLALLTAYGLGYSKESAAAAKSIISGTVTDDNGPVAKATVRVQGPTNYVLTNAAGFFKLRAPAAKAVNIAAWREGYYCAILQEIRAPAQELRLKLTRYQTNDNSAYEWIPPETPAGTGGCSQCHTTITEMALKDAHMKAAANPRFLTMFNGTDTEGNQSPPTRYDYGKWSWQYIIIPYPPDLSQPYFGPGYLLDFPGTTGTWTACHIAGASVAGNIDPNTVSGTDKYGIHCDFCHKVADVRLDPVSRMPLPSLPGVHSLDVRRPFTDDPERPQLFFG